MYRDDTTQALSGLYYWDQGINWGLLNSLSALDVSGSLPNGAAFAWDSIFYIPSLRNVLSRIRVTYGADGIPDSATREPDYTIAAPTSQPSLMAFGDIVIQPQTYRLYGSTSTGQFFMVDLSDLDAPGGLPFTIILQSAVQPSVQTGE